MTTLIIEKPEGAQRGVKKKHKKKIKEPAERAEIKTGNVSSLRDRQAPTKAQVRGGGRWNRDAIRLKGGEKTASGYCRRRGGWWVGGKTERKGTRRLRWGGPASGNSRKSGAGTGNESDWRSG